MQVESTGKGLNLIPETDLDRKIIDEFGRYRNEIKVRVTDDPRRGGEITFYLPLFILDEKGVEP